MHCLCISLITVLYGISGKSSILDNLPIMLFSDFPVQVLAIFMQFAYQDGPVNADRDCTRTLFTGLDNFRESQIRSAVFMLRLISRICTIIIPELNENARSFPEYDFEGSSLWFHDKQPSYSCNVSPRGTHVVVVVAVVVVFHRNSEALVPYRL